MAEVRQAKQLLGSLNASRDLASVGELLDRPADLLRRRDARLLLQPPEARVIEGGPINSPELLAERLRRSVPQLVPGGVLEHRAWVMALLRPLQEWRGLGGRRICGALGWLRLFFRLRVGVGQELVLLQRKPDRAGSQAQRDSRGVGRRWRHQAQRLRHGQHPRQACPVAPATLAGHLSGTP